MSTRQYWFVLLFFILKSDFVFAQSVGIGTTTPSSAAALDITSNNKGILIPRLTQSQRNAIIPPVTGLLVYQVDADSSFFWYNGIAWIKLLGSGSGWALTGNANTTNINFIGTTDNRNLLFKRNNIKSGWIDSTNTSFGVAALLSSTSSTHNTAMGGYTLYANTVGNANSAFGYGSLSSNISGIRNTGVGVNTLYLNTSGSDNTAIGTLSMSGNLTGMLNTAIGVQSLFSNSTGAGNTATGYNSLYTNSTGTLNTANGFYSLVSNTTGSNNTATGADALNANTTGSFNTAIGNGALNSNTDGFSNTAVGNQALYANVSGIFNTATGNTSLYANQSGSFNTGNGYASLMANTTGIANTANGFSSLANNTTGNYNVAIGTDVLVSNLSGKNNTAIGYRSLATNTLGSGSAAVGDSALHGNTFGVQNTAVGKKAGIANTTGSSNTAIGFNSNFGSGNLTNATAVGANALVNTSNSLVLGNNVNVGIGTSAPQQKLEVIGSIKTNGFIMPPGAGEGKVLTSDAIGNAEWVEKVIFKVSGFLYDFTVAPGPFMGTHRDLYDWANIDISVGPVLFNNSNGHIIVPPGVYRVEARVNVKFDTPDESETHALEIWQSGFKKAEAHTHLHHDHVYGSFQHVFNTVSISTIIQVTDSIDDEIGLRYWNHSTNTTAHFINDNNSTPGMERQFCEFSIQRIN